MGGELDKSRTADNQSHSSYLDGAIDAVWRRDPNATGPQAQDYLKDLIKTVPLFMGGKVALAGAAALNAVDQMHPGDSAGTQLLDGAMGATKGAAEKMIFDKIGAANVNFVVKGVGMGMTARTLEVGLNRQTYMENGEFSPWQGLKQTAWTTVGPKNLAADMIIGGMGAGALKGLNAAGFGHLNESRLVGNVLTGTVFGGSSGMYQEIQRQTAQGQLDPLAIAKQTFIHGGIGGLGAAPGGLQGALRYRVENFGPVPLEQSQANRSRLVDPVEKLAPAPRRVDPSAQYESKMEFYTKGIANVDVPVREYSVTGHSTKIQVPVEYDNALPKIREMRDTAAQPLFGDKLNLAQTMRVASARLQLDSDPMRARYLPEDLVRGLDMAPNSKLINDLMAMADKPPYEVRIKGYKESNGAIAEMLKGGRLLFYKPPESWHPDNTMLHEWSHIQHGDNKPAFAAFHAALKLEQYGYDYRDYAKFNVNENWAVNSEPLLGASDKEFRTFVDAAPVRAAVMGRALQESLSAVPANQRTPHQNVLAERAKYIETNVVPEAHRALMKMGGGSAESGQAADIVTDFLNGKIDTARAEQILNMPWEYDYYRE
jgi:hypothetical protein